MHKPSVKFRDINKMRSSDSALNFLANIDIDDIDDFMYSDNLCNFTDLSSEVGTFEVTVKKSCYDLTGCIEIKLKNEIVMSGIVCQTEIVGFIGQNLKTLYQTFDEILKFSDYKITKRVIIQKTSTGYDIDINSNENDVIKHVQKSFSKSAMKGYVSESATVLLHRLFAVRGLPNKFFVIAFNQYWDLSCASYKELGNFKLPIQDRKVDVKGIERVVFSAENYETIWRLYFRSDGYLMSKVQIGSPISMKVKEFTEVAEKDSFLTKPVFKMSDLIWEDDVQMISRFLDMKEVNKSNSLRYLRDHMEIKMILRGFMQAVLIRKPKDPFEFASRYFVTFSCKAKSEFIYENSNAKNDDFLI